MDTIPKIELQAGAIISGTGAAPLLEMMLGTYESDWHLGTPLPATAGPWTAEELGVIRNTALIPVRLPTPGVSQAAYYNPPKPAPVALSGQTSVTASTSPDFDSLLPYMDI
jgi:hypothetical protein